MIACNTATTRCIHELRRRFPEVTFVGMEPALKLACDHGAQKILLLATPNTAASRQVQRLVEQNIRTQDLTILPCPGLADLIEREASIVGGVVRFEQAGFDTRLRSALDELWRNLSDRTKFDAIVLGCTHYVHIAEQIQSYFPQAQLFDGNAGVVRQAQRLLGARTA